MSQNSWAAAVDVQEATSLQVTFKGDPTASKLSGQNAG